MKKAIDLASLYKFSKALNDGKEPAYLTIIRDLQKTDQTNTRNLLSELRREKGSILLVGAPGTGKSEIANILADISLFENRGREEGGSYKHNVQLTPNYTYEDAIEGLRPFSAYGGNIFLLVDGWLGGIVKMLNGLEYSTLAANAYFKPTKKNGKLQLIDFEFDYPEWDWGGKVHNDAASYKIQYQNGVTIEVNDTQGTPDSALAVKPEAIGKKTSFKINVVNKSFIDRFKIKKQELQKSKSEDQQYTDHLLIEDVEDIKLFLEVFGHQLVGTVYLKQSFKNIRIKSYTVVVDEINRANTTAVFGEMMQIMEGNKPSINLPISGAKVFWPKELKIIGTMNLADHTLSEVDLAFKRRFFVKNVKPDPSVVKNKNSSRDVMIYINDVLKKHNPNRLLGHAYFLKEGSERSLISNIISQLQIIIHDPQTREKLRLDSDVECDSFVDWYKHLNANE